MTTTAAARPGPPSASPAREPVLSVRDLCVDYGSPRGDVHAVRDVSLDLYRGEMLGLAGESGCGKSTLAYALNRLVKPPGRISGGSVVFHPRGGAPVEVTSMGREQLRAFRWSQVAMVFQSAMNSLNPVISVRRQLEDVLRTHRPSMRKEQRRARCGELLELVGIPRERLHSFPHELSGGMRQRVMIAMAMALEPDVVVMDEPTTALDVVVQRDILDEIDRLRAELGFSVLFITHDLSLLLEISDRVAIMYGGRIVETGTAEQIRGHARHPYTLGLLEAFPSLRGPRRDLHGIPGQPPDLADPPPGCPFAARCPHVQPVCTERAPEFALSPERPRGTYAACHLWDADAHPAGPPASVLRGEFRLPAGIPTADGLPLDVVKEER